jgi:hypothetical protein
LAAGRDAGAAPDPSAYAATFPNPNDPTSSSYYGAVDLATGGFTEISTLPFSAAGFARSGAYLYTAPYAAEDNDFSADPNFYRLTPSTGALQAVSAAGLGDAGVAFLGLGSTPGGMFAIGADPVTGDFDLFAISTSGASILIGSTGLTPPAGEVSLSTGSATLYMANENELYSVNTTTATVSDIGPIGTTGDGFAALTEVGSVLYGAYVDDQYSDTTSELYSLATSSPGGGAYIASVLPASGQIYALAAVPEPPDWALMLVGFGGLGYALRRRTVRPTGA